jgi:hypothetical protein
MSPEDLVLALFWSNSAQSIIALAIGFALSGALSNGYQLLTAKPASFRLLEHTERKQALAAVPFLVFAAPFIIMRNTIRSRRVDADGGSFGFAAMATRVAGFWSLMSGTIVVMLLQKAGHIIA